MSAASTAPTRRVLHCEDGQPISTQWFAPAPETDCGDVVVITPATGAKGSYYGRFAGYLAAHGHHAVTMDYRGVGASRPPGSARGMRSLRRHRWYEWATQDVEAVLRAARDHVGPHGRVLGVGHSFGGLGLVLAPSAGELARVLTVGAQHAYWPDYKPGHRRGMVLRWHVAMPVIAGLMGYVPARRLGWMEDVPRGVALDWARSRRVFFDSMGRQGPAARTRMRELTCEVLAVAATDDPFATPRAVERLLAYLPNARTRTLLLEPEALGVAEIGHLGAFHGRFRQTLWPRMLAWLEHGHRGLGEGSGR